MRVVESRMMREMLRILRVIFTMTDSTSFCTPINELSYCFLGHVHDKIRGS
jgi:hypothetical protein